MGVGEQGRAMQDTNITNHREILNTLTHSVSRLARANNTYGVDFKLWRTGISQITLELTNDIAVIDKVVLELNSDVSNVTEMSERGWVLHIKTLFEKALLEKEY